MKDFIHLFLPPRFPHDKERTRIAEVLNTILIGSMAVLFLALIALPFLYEEKFYSILFSVAFFAALLVVYWILHSGRVKRASIFLVSGIWVITTVFIFYAGGIKSVFVVFYIAFTVITGLLLGMKVAVIYAICCSLAGLIMVIAGAVGFLPTPIFPIPAKAAWFDVTLSLLLTITAMGITLRSLNDALTRAHQSESRYITLFEDAPIMYLTTQNKGGKSLISNCNEAFLKNLGYSREEVIDRPLADFYSELSQFANIEAEGFQRALRDEMKFSVERQLITKDGRTIHTLLNVAPEINEKGETVGLLASYLDITERKQMESQRDDMLEKISNSLTEKETLLRELHHRTNNNMSVINALLDIQAAEFNNEQLQAVFKETQNRIHSMALVHRKLYEGEDLSRINLKEYIADLIQLLQKSYQITPGQISIETEMEDIWILIDSAIPCGLILNELLSNAFKHAFPHKQKGTITVTLNKSNQDDIILHLADNGIGLPDRFDLERDRNIGLQNVFNLVEYQLEGTIRFESDNGVHCVIQFRDNLYQPRV